jgi:hypothetical protein
MKVREIEKHTKRILVIVGREYFAAVGDSVKQREIVVKYVQNWKYTVDEVAEYLDMLYARYLRLKKMRVNHQESWPHFQQIDRMIDDDDATVVVVYSHESVIQGNRTTT